MQLSKTKKIILLGATLGILTTSIAVPILLLNKDKNNEENDVEKLFKILKAKTSKEKIIELPSNASGKIIANNQEKIVAKIKTLIGKANLKEVKIEVLMKNDVSISTTPQKIIIKLTKNELSKEIKDFSIKKKNVIDEEIESIKKILDAKTKNDLIIILPSSSTGNIIGNAINKDAILKKLRMLIDPLNNNGDPNHKSLRGTSIQISMTNDIPISTTPQDIIVEVSKTGGKTLRTTSIFQVKRAFTTSELANKDILSIKNILDGKTNENLIITLPSNSTGNIIENATNKNAIEKKLRILIDPSNTNGVANHSSLKGTSLEVSMSVDAPISTTSQNIIVSISKSGGKTLSTTEIFQVKRDFTADEDIVAIKTILDAKTNNDLIIILPSSSTGNIIGNATNKNAIERKLRILIDPSNTNGKANHSSLRGTSIQVSMDVDAPISTTPQNIIVEVSKTNGTTLRITETFQVRIFTANEDIKAIKKILESKSGNDLIITLPSDSIGYINDKNNRDAIERKLRMLIDPSNTNGNSNHSSLRGTTISSYTSFYMTPISTIAQDINVAILKTGGTGILTRNKFQVKKST